MTRETKIGLLVGLAFIIVIGILLSDHLNGANGSLPATLTQTGPGVRSTLTTPGAAQSTPIVAATAPQIVTPQYVVPTPRDLAPQTPANEVIRVGSTATLQAPTQGVISVQTQPQQAQSGPVVEFVPNPQQPQQVAQQPPIRVVQPQQTSSQQRPIDSDDVIATIAAQNGEQLVTTTPTGGMRPIVSTGGAASGTRDYVAEDGDSLSRIAQKFLGSAGKNARDAIIKVNPTLQANPDMVVVGKTYKIPTAIATPPTAAAQQTIAVPQQQQQPRQVAPAVQQRPAPANENWYTVQPGDNLTKIARDVLGDTNAVNAIKELNKETLNGGDKLQVNMKLRLPGKSVVQAN